MRLLILIKSASGHWADKISLWVRWRIDIWLYGRVIYRGAPLAFIPKIFCHEDTKIAYVHMNKVGGQSIRRSFFESEPALQDFIQKQKQYRKETPPRIMNLDYCILFSDQKALQLGEHPELNYLNLVRMNLNKIKALRYQNHQWVMSGYDRQTGFQHKPVDLSALRHYFFFTFVRNPFSRLISAFQSKFKYKPHNNKDLFIFIHDAIDYLKQVNNFTDLVKKLSIMPDEMINIHLRPQTFTIDIFSAQIGPLNHIGRFENLEEEFEVIRKKYNLLPLKHFNPDFPHKKEDREHKIWADYYTPKTAQLVFDRYQKDFERLGYEEEYPKLLNFLKQKKT